MNELYCAHMPWPQSYPCERPAAVSWWVKDQTNIWTACLSHYSDVLSLLNQARRHYTVGEATAL